MREDASKNNAFTGRVWRLHREHKRCSSRKDKWRVKCNRRSNKYSINLNWAFQRTAVSFWQSQEEGEDCGASLTGALRLCGCVHVYVWAYVNAQVCQAKTSIYLGLQCRQATLRSPAGQELSAPWPPTPVELWEWGGVCVCLCNWASEGASPPPLCVSPPWELLSNADFWLIKRRKKI